MEYVHGRPPIGDIFRLPNQALNEDNDYLHKVGLIILIRGSATPDTPQQITEKLVSVFGGQPMDYVVTQATITPFLITCRTQQLRDAIVRGGIYTIPNAQVQFTVHEWRPRFGMGYDPPSHQVWVKIIGLPLQAWTRPQIIAILQAFGHPQQILPFGEQAGHYRDITALVATKHPSRIPLGYMYREGDFVTQVDVFLLNWRVYEESYFPPPPDHPLPQNHSPVHTHEQDDPTVPLNRSSSSSSNNAPSEPSIDYSSWSPRSYSKLRWIPKTKLISSQDTLMLPPSQTKTIPLAGKLSMAITLFPDLYQRQQATEDPPRVANQTMTRTYPIAGHIIITPTLACNGPKPDSRAWGVALGSLATDCFSTIPLVQVDLIGNDPLTLNLAGRRYSPIEMLLYSFFKHLLSQVQAEGPMTQPTNVISLLQYQMHTKAQDTEDTMRLLNQSWMHSQPNKNVNKQGQTIEYMTQHHCKIDSFNLSRHANSFTGPCLNNKGGGNHNTKVIRPRITYMINLHGFTHNPMLSPKKRFCSVVPIPISNTSPDIISEVTPMPIISNSSTSASNPTFDEHLALASTTMEMNSAQKSLADAPNTNGGNGLQRKKMRRPKQTPIRRSLRIQEKSQSDSARPQAQIRTKTKSKPASLPFDLDSNQAPLDANKVL